MFAIEGATVYLTVNPKERMRYKLDTLRVTYNDGEEHDVEIPQESNLAILRGFLFVTELFVFIV